MLPQDTFDCTGNVLTGTLSSGNACVYPIENGILRFITEVANDQQQAKEYFGSKWKQTHIYDSASSQQGFKKWLIERDGFKNEIV